jgi:hypothetical protein
MLAINDVDKPSPSRCITRAGSQQVGTRALAMGISHDIQTTAKMSFILFPTRDDAKSSAIQTSSVLDEAKQLFEIQQWIGSIEVNQSASIGI